MNNQQASPTRTAGGEPLRSARVPGRWLLLARGTWITLVVLSLVIFFASLPEHLTRLHTLCAPSACSALQLAPEQAAVLRRVGWSLEDYATLLVALTMASAGLNVLLSTLIIWRRPDDRMALLVAFMIVPPGLVIATSTVSTGGPSPWQVPNQGLGFFGLALVMLVFSLFPSGQFVPRWTRWTLVVGLAGLVPYDFFPTTLPLHQVGFLLFLGEAALLVGAQAYRYRWVSSPRERQQTKWVIFAFTVSGAVYIGGNVLSELFPTLSDRTAPAGAPYQLVLNSFGLMLTGSVPLAFGVAMLRYRLWEIDTLLNKALVYGLLTSLLGTLYAGLIIGLEHLASLITSQVSEQPVALVISTLAIAALFLPMRRRIQALIDRHFYRKKYDAEKTLAAFSATLRLQVDLEQIRSSLRVMVSETMQPASLSLWIFPLKPQAAAEGTKEDTRSPAEERASAERREAQ
jgi:hypothetical protein